MAIGFYCNREVVIVEPEASVLEAAMLMREHHVGTLVVTEKTEKGNRPKGIITDRDLVLEIMAPNLRPEAILVSDVMTEALVTAREVDPVIDVVRAMRGHGVRRVLVVNDEGYLEGIVSMDDLVVMVAEEMDEIATLIVREQNREAVQRK